MSRKVTSVHPTQGPFYLVGPTGGTMKAVGPSARKLALYGVRVFGMKICSIEEWRAARRKQNREEAP